MKTYHILLDGMSIGTSALEKADASMGVVFGEIHFLNIRSPYDFFRTYCQNNQVSFNEQSDERMISTRTIPGLVVINEMGHKIVSLGNNVAGMDGDVFEIVLEGIPYPFYAEEFPEHVKAMR